MMESIRQKTFRLLKEIPLIPVIPVFILLLSSNLFATVSFKVDRVTNGDPIKIQNNTKTVTMRLIRIDAPETPKKKNEPGQPFCQTATKHLASLVLNNFVDIESYGTDRHSRILALIYCNGANVNRKMAKAELAEVYRGKPAGRLDNDP